MPGHTTETRTFVGEPATWPGYGYAGYVVGQHYELQVQRPGDGTVEITSAHPLMRRAVVSERLFERWWKPLRGAGGAEGGAV